VEIFLSPSEYGSLTFEQLLAEESLLVISREMLYLTRVQPAIRLVRTKDVQEVVVSKRRVEYYRVGVRAYVNARKLLQLVNAEIQRRIDSDLINDSDHTAI